MLITIVKPNFSTNFELSIMSKFSVNKAVPNLGDPEFIRINTSKRTVNTEITIFEVIEHDQIVLYIPSFELSGYGNNYEEAKEMLDESVNYFLTNLIKLTPDKINLELAKLGWKKNKFKNKEFSKAYIDKNGILKGFDVSPDKITERKYDFAI